MEEYKSNSHKSKEEQRNPVKDKKIEKIISGSVRAKKKTSIQKFTDIFISEDMGSVKSYIVEDIVVPAVKDIILDAAKAFLGINDKHGKNSNSSKISYRSYYDKANDRKDYNASKIRVGYGYDNIVLDNRGEAEEVLSKMDELISMYGLVSVADLYDLIGMDGNYTDTKYGWTDIRNASVVRVREGYMLKMPKALPLN